LFLLQAVTGSLAFIMAKAGVWSLVLPYNGGPELCEVATSKPVPATTFIINQ